MSKYPIIIFEGIEASGKTTNFKIAANYLKKRRKSFIKLREPGGSIFSEKIRKLILNKKLNLNNKTDLLLFYAGRSENFEKIIKKNYKKKIILIDRFIDSTIAYQHYGMGINYNLINSINKYLIKDINIDCIFLNTVSTKKLKIRLKKRRNLNKYDRFKLSFYKKVQKGFLKLSKNKKNYTIIDSNKDINVNKKIILNKIDKLIFN